MTLADIRAVFGDDVTIAADLSFMDRDYGDALDTPAKIKARTLTCRRCTLRDGCDRPTLWHGGPEADIAVLMGAPGDVRAVKMLTALFEWSGLDDWDIGWAHVVACETEKPQRIEMARCRPLMFDHLAQIGARVVLLVGATAMEAWRPDLNVTTWAGHVGIWGENLLVMPIVHPGYLYTGHGSKKTERQKVIDQLTVLEQILAGTVDPRDHIGRKCGAHHCIQGGITYIDPDGIGWCRGHEPIGRETWREQRDHWIRWELADQPLQPELPI